MPLPTNSYTTPVPKAAFETAHVAGMIFFINEAGAAGGGGGSGAARPTTGVLWPRRGN